MFGYLAHSAVMARGRPDPSSVEEIAARLRLIRTALGKTQAFMSQMIGSATDGQAWGNYETGERRISLDHALTLCQRTGLTLDFIYRGNMVSLPEDLGQKIQTQIRSGIAAKKRRP